MATSFFELKPKKKITKPVKEKTKVLLTKHEEKGNPASLTYLDNNGNLQNVTTGFSKNADGSYIMTYTYIARHPIYEKEEISYISVDDHFSYKDKDGKYRVFNRLDTLKYDENTNTYTGVVEDIEYITSTVEVFVKED